MGRSSSTLHSSCIHDSFTLGGRTTVLGMAVKPVSRNSFTSLANSVPAAAQSHPTRPQPSLVPHVPAVYTCSKMSFVTWFTTNSPDTSMLHSESFLDPSRFLVNEKARAHGFEDTGMKNDSGARLSCSVPSWSLPPTPCVLIKPIGRGTIAPHSKLYASLLARWRTSRVCMRRVRIPWPDTIR